MADVQNLVRAGVQYPDIPGPRIKVRATRMGEYEFARRRAGDIFTLKPRYVIVCNPVSGKPEYGADGKPKTVLKTAQDQFSARWMEKVGDDAEEVITSAQEALNVATAEIITDRRPGNRKKE